MTKIIKDIYVTWDWEGDEYALIGFNVAIVPAGGNPNEDIIRKEQTGKERSYRGGKTKPSLGYEHIFRNVIIEEGGIDVYVQALYADKDSDWVRKGGGIVADDGTATIATSKDIEDLESSLGSLAYKDLVEKAELGQTIIEGGHIRADLLTANNVVTGTLQDKQGKSYINLDDGKFGFADGKLTYDGQTLVLDSTVLIGNNIASNLETKSGAQSKADKAKSDAESYATSEINKLENNLTNEINNLESSLGDEINNLENNLTNEINNLESSLGDLAYKDLVEKAQLGSTIIQGGYIRTDLLTANNIVTGTLKDKQNRSYINLDNGTFSFADGKLIYNGSKLMVTGDAEIEGYVKASKGFILPIRNSTPS